jgi:uncharacterized LabA/DUF88 family protein
MKRTAFLVDGFNLYHSITEAAAARPGSSLKWLDLRALWASLLHVIGNHAHLEAVYYFSALATHRQSADPHMVQRHRCLLACLEATGICIELGRFKPKRVYCPTCKTMVIRHEEKETDVAVAVRLLELFFTEACDTAVLVTGDTDLAPAIRTARQRFPHQREKTSREHRPRQ